MPPRPPLPKNPYRLFHLSARLRLRDRPTPTPSTSPPSRADDYYALLLHPTTPSPTAAQTIKPSLPPQTPPPQSSASTLPPPSTATTQPSNKSEPDTKILFSRDVSGPSPKLRGLERAERDLERPPEPDNCCMSGCVNCVWDAYREEVEAWAAARRARAYSLATEAVGNKSGGRGRDVEGVEGVGGGVGDGDEVGGVGGMGEEGEEALFEGVEVGIREFMRLEKRIRERRGDRGDDVGRGYEGRSIESWRVGGGSGREKEGRV